MGWRRMPRSFAPPPPLHNKLAPRLFLPPYAFYLRMYFYVTVFVPPVRPLTVLFDNCFS